MPTQIISTVGSQHGLVVNSDGSINVSGVQVTLSGATLSTLGSSYPIETVPTSTVKTNPRFLYTYITSGTATGVTGSEIGSIFQYIGTGSYAQSYTWSNNIITNVSAWVQV